MSIRRVTAAVGSAALLFAFTGMALAVTPSGTLDQKHECAATDCNTIAHPFVTGGDALYPAWYSQNGSPSGTVNLAQTFTAGITGKLTGVEIYAQGRDIGEGGPPATFTIRVESTTSSDHHPSGTVLASASVATPGTTTVGWIGATFASQPSVTAGTVYAITLGDLPFQVPSQAWLRWQLDSSTNGAYTNYAGGEAFAATGTTWASLIGIISDGGTGSADLAFRTFVQAAPVATPTPTPKPSGTLPATATQAPPASGTDGNAGLPVIVLGLVLVGLFVVVGLPKRTHTRG